MKTSFILLSPRGVYSRRLLGGERLGEGGSTGGSPLT